MIGGMCLSWGERAPCERGLQEAQERAKSAECSVDEGLGTEGV